MPEQMPSVKKKELQNSDKMSGALLKLKENEKIWYNHPQLTGTHKAPKSSWNQQIKKAKETDPDYENYKGRETQLKTTYIPNEITKEFVTKFHKKAT